MSVRRRYYFWLFKAYLIRWYKTIFSSLLAGVVVFFILGFVANFYFLPSLQKKVQKIGYVGIYTINNLPEQILSDVSYGLTKLDLNGKVLQGAAVKWEIRNSGKQYIFHLRPGQKFHNGHELTSQNIPFSFKDVDKKNINKYTVMFNLKSAYSPFTRVLAKPILDNGFSGLGKYQVSKIEINGGFVRSLTLQELKDKSHKKLIFFYPSQEALKDAYALGDIDIAKGILSTNIKNSNFNSWDNTKVSKNISEEQLVTLFYNNTDKMFAENRKLRQALSYAIPAKFSEGERAYSPISKRSLFFTQSPNYGISDLDISKNLLTGQEDVLKKTIEISTTEEYKEIAEKVSKSWKKIGIKSKIKLVDSMPNNFQVLIYPIKLPADPDQYTLWHSAQVDNITHYKSFRIDKLLEDGRSTTDEEKRIQIYADFQKYLIDDAPATFLYFPILYDLTRK